MTEKHIYIDVWNPMENRVDVVQGEVSARYVVAHIHHSGVPLNLDGASVQVYGTKPDGTGILNECQVVDATRGQVSIPMSQQMSIAPGEYEEAGLQIVRDGKILKVLGLSIVVHPAYDYDEDISEDELTAVQEAIDRSNYAVSRVPSIGKNGNWYLGDEDTGEPSRGKNGTSVTVSSVSESAEDGGSNVVNFSDGKSLTVRNGKQGSPGNDYVLTDADKQEIAGMVDVSTVPDYWVSELETKADAIQTAMEKAGRNKSAFLWYTDAHWANGNSKMSPALLNYLYMHTPMNKVNFGGDIIGDTLLATREEMKYLYEWRKAIKDLPNHHSVLGNHDMFSLDTVDYEDDNYRYAFMIAPEETPDMVMGDGNYYYIDNPCERTRYLYIGYPNTAQADLMAQSTFIADALKSTPEGWHIVAIAHRWWQYSSSSKPTTGAIGAFEADILSVFDAYNARQSRNGSNYFYAQDFTNAKGKVEFCIGGHIHVDYDIESDGGIPVIITTADTNQNRVPDSTVDSGTVGTITEAAVFGIIADYNDADNIKITVVGVGRGTSRIVRKSTVKPTSISNITYSGDTTVGAVIDKAKFSFTVNYSNGTTETVNGATSVSPATIGMVGNNTVTITYVEGGTTLSGTVTIVGTAAPVANLINLDRAYVSGTEGELMANNLDESKAFLNIGYAATTFNAKSCTVSGVTEDSVTMKESGAGGICVGYPVYLPDLPNKAYKITFDYSGTGKCRTYYRYAVSGTLSGSNSLYVDDTAGASGYAEATIPLSTDKYTWVVLYFSSNTSGTKTFENVSLTEA